MTTRKLYIVIVLIFSIIVSATVKNTKRKETLQQVYSVVDSVANEKDSLFVTIDVTKQRDTIVYDDGIFVTYPKEIDLQIKVMKGADKVEKLVVYNKTFVVNSNKNK